MSATKSTHKITDRLIHHRIDDELMIPFVEEKFPHLSRESHTPSNIKISPKKGREKDVWDSESF